MLTVADGEAAVALGGMIPCPGIDVFRGARLLHRGRVLGSYRRARTRISFYLWRSTCCRRCRCRRGRVPQERLGGGRFDFKFRTERANCEKFARKNYLVCTWRFFFHARRMEIVTGIPCTYPLDYFNVRVDMEFHST